MRRVGYGVVLLFLLGRAVYAQTENTSLAEMAACTFSDEKDLSLRYDHTAAPKKDLTFGKVWAPNDVPLALFTSTPLVIGKTDVPVGAYTIYFIPDKNAWTIIVSKNVTAGAKYDESQDLARAPMEVEKLPAAADQLSIYFGHIAPKICNMRLDYGKVRVSTNFTEK